MLLQSSDQSIKISIGLKILLEQVKNRKSQKCHAWNGQDGSGSSANSWNFALCLTFFFLESKEL